MKKVILTFVALLCINIAFALTTCNSCATCTTAAATPDEVVQLTTSLTTGSICINITAARVTIDCNGFSMTGNKSTGNIAITTTDSIPNATVQSCTIRNFERGTHFYNSDNSTIKNSIFSNNTYASRIYSSHRQIFRENNYSDNQNSIYFEGTSFGDNLNSWIYNNSITSTTSSWGKLRIGGFGGANGLNFTKNTVVLNDAFSTFPFDHPFNSYYTENFIRINGGMFNGQGGGPNEVRNNIINLTGAANIITFYNSGDWDIVNNTFYGVATASGLVADRGPGNSLIENNTFYGFATTIYLNEGFANTIVKSNRIYNSANIGILIGEAFNITVSNNYFENVGTTGVQLSDVGHHGGALVNLADNCTVSGNIFNSTPTAIYIKDTSKNNIIGANTFYDVDNYLRSTSSGQNQVVSSPLKLTNGSSQILWPSITGTIGNLSKTVKIGYGYIAVNGSSESALNSSANVTLAISACPETLYYYSNFSENLDEIEFNGQLCNATTTPACTNIQCSGQTVSFNVPHFDTYGGEGIQYAVPEFNLMTIILVMIGSLTIISLVRQKE